MILVLGLAAGGSIAASGQEATAHWPEFRGAGHAGVADGHDLPAQFDIDSGMNVRWQADIPGLGHSSPIVWGDTVYLTTAVSSDIDPIVLTGSSDAAGIETADDRVAHGWQLIALESRSGRILWAHTAWESVPRVQRHRKASHASATPATNGDRIVALLDSEGLFCFDMDGTLLWRTDVGVLDVGYWGEPEYQWGSASSPVIYENLVLVQNDRQSDSFVAAYDLANGEEVWRVARDEKPAWSTPTIVRAERDELVLNGARYYTGYDPRTGRELWRLSNGDAEVIVPTPIVAGDRLILTGGYPTGSRPIYALRIGGSGDLGAEAGTAPGQVAWSSDRGSPYTPTPIAYRGVVYSIVDNGILSAYDLATGERLYRDRLEVGAGFSASPVASDGKLYFASEDGDVFVVAAGREFELLARNTIGEILMASPAIVDGTLLVRGQRRLYAIGS